MTKFLTSRHASIGISIILFSIIIFHLLVIAKIIPSNIVWGGNISDNKELVVMETVSIAINALLLFFVLAHLGMMKIKVNSTFLRVFFWIMFILFLLNTIGNLLAKQNLETYIFTPLTILLSLFSLRIALEGKKEN